MSPNVKSQSILVIEDDPDVLSVIVRHLNHHGYNVMVAADGMEGLKKLEEGGYDLVITDIVMPYVSGVGIVSKVKSSYAEIPVIAITGYGKEPETAAIESKADLVLSKPVRMTSLLGHIQKLLEDRK